MITPPIKTNRKNKNFFISFIFYSIIRKYHHYFSNNAIFALKFCIFGTNILQRMLIDRKTNIHYFELTDYLRNRFPDVKVQKISINAGFSCPNRDGAKGFGGCTYCNNQTFNPEYCTTAKALPSNSAKGSDSFHTSIGR